MNFTSPFQPLTSRGSTVQTEGAVSTLPRTSAATVRTVLSDPSEYDLEEKLENLRDARMRLELQLPALVRVSSEEDLLSTDMSRAGSLEDIPGTPATPGAPAAFGGSRESDYSEELDSVSGKRITSILISLCQETDKNY